jgi:hypothetical protein
MSAFGETQPVRIATSDDGFGKASVPVRHSNRLKLTQVDIRPSAEEGRVS